MNNRLFFGAWLMFSSVGALAQNDFQATYEAFRQQAEKRYGDFRRQCNEEYAEFMENAWRRFNDFPPKMPPLQEKPVPPILYQGDGEELQDRQLPRIDILPIAPPIPQPKPVEPIQEQPQPTEERFAFQFYGTQGLVRLDNSMRFSLVNTSEARVAEAWRGLSEEGKLDNVIRDCLELRIRH